MLIKEKKPCLDSYWKGLITEIKKLDEEEYALVKVRWFWSKADVIAAIQGQEVDEKLRRLAHTSLTTAMFSHLRHHSPEFWNQWPRMSYGQVQSSLSTRLILLSVRRSLLLAAAADVITQPT